MQMTKRGSPKEEQVSMKRQAQIRRQVLLVDDEEEILSTLKLNLQINGVGEVLTLSDSREVLPLLASKPVAVMVLDLTMPHLSGVELLRTVARDYTHIPVVVVTANDETDTAVDCMKHGAFDYLVKPVDSARLLTTIKKALELSCLSGEVSSLKHRLLSEGLDNPGAFAAIVTRNRKMRALFQYAEVVAGCSQPIIVTGETGVGKELVARAVHELSGCRGEFVALNVAGLDDQMFSDALFGHRKGAFTGADQGREGLIARAADGTLFLDEIGDLNEMSQVKLLRLLQEREYYPVGSDVTRKTNAHLVLATNRDLQKLIAAGKFRNDLYYRLCAHQIHIPPLRERMDDLPLLLEHFIHEEANRIDIAPPSYTKELIDLLERYPFPGNVRELQAMVSDAVPRSRSGSLSHEPFCQAIAELGEHSQPAQAPTDGSLHAKLEAIWGHFPTLREAEELLIKTALQTTKGNQVNAATMLGVKRKSVYELLYAKKGAY
jgi:two-component system response regulator HydG